MKAEAHVTTKVVLVLNEDEARSLHALMQNPFMEPEPEDTRELRGEIWHALHAALHPDT